MRRDIGLLLVLMVGGGCGNAGTEEASEPEVRGIVEAVSKKDFDVQFSGCNVFAGLAHVSGARARALVPPEYTLSLDSGAARMVVRVAHCSDVIVDGKATGSTIISHIGIGLAGPDTTVSLNNYTLWYATNNAPLHAKLTAAGVSADKSNSLDIDLSSGGTLTVSSNSPHTPTFQVNGTAVLPTATPIPTSASWWDDGKHGPVRSRTVLPAIQFGTAHTVLSTPANSELAALIGAPTITFDILDSYNLFPGGTMEVRSSP